ncbi:hypothetical protein [Sphingomonas bacterium]|uniref:hypothetical protein n=1 Tax=Sphingomonas bacterium TaxID=1895847 RepID=UPI00157717D7|nr:hypothetical protein [Sphingomonas bacterium]
MGDRRDPEHRAALRFVLVRAASLHDVDILLGRGAMGITVNLVAEMGAIALDVIAALLAWRRFRKERSTGCQGRYIRPA